MMNRMIVFEKRITTLIYFVWVKFYIFSQIIISFKRSLNRGFERYSLIWWMIVRIISRSSQSKSESSAESRPLHVVIDMLLGDGFLDNFFHWERSISGRIEVRWSGVKGSFSGSPLFNFSELNLIEVTLAFFSDSATLTMCPKEGMTLMLMLLSKGRVTRLLIQCSGMTCWSIRKWYFKNIK